MSKQKQIHRTMLICQAHHRQIGKQQFPYVNLIVFIMDPNNLFQHPRIIIIVWHFSSASIALQYHIWWPQILGDLIDIVGGGVN